MADEPSTPTEPEVEPLPVRGSIDFTVTAALERDKYRVRVMGSGFGLNYEMDDAGTRCQWYVPESALASCVDVFGGAKVH